MLSLVQGFVKQLVQVLSGASLAPPSHLKKRAQVTSSIYEQLNDFSSKKPQHSSSEYFEIPDLTLAPVISDRIPPPFCIYKINGASSKS
jgi:hypothetical protein